MITFIIQTLIFVCYVLIHTACGGQKPERIYVLKEISLKM